MSRRAPQHLQLCCHRFMVTTTKRQASNKPTDVFGSKTATKRWFASRAKKREYSATTTTSPSASSSSSSSSSSSANNHRQALVAYATAGATLGVVTCYRSDSMIANDPYNLGGTVLALLAFYGRASNSTTTTTIMASNPITFLPFLFGVLVVGEFLGNGFRQMQYNNKSLLFAVANTKEERHQLIHDVAEMTSQQQQQQQQDELMDGLGDHGKDDDLLDVVLLEDTISSVLLQSKTRWAHLSGFYESVPDHMTQHELKIAIHRWAMMAGEEVEEGASQKKEVVADEKEALLQVMSVADINNDGIITFMEFSRALLLLELSKQQKQLSSAKSELYFRAIDLNNSGSISVDELLHFARRLHALGGIPHKDRTTTHWSGLYERPSTPEEICEKWMERFDVNHDGVISREEFGKMAKEIDFGPSFLFTKYFDSTTTSE